MVTSSISITGHRGAAGLAPENTLAAFSIAQSLGCHAVEFDVRLTRDGKLAVIHDADLSRTTEGTGLVSAFNMSELKLLNAGNGETIPELVEVFDLLQQTDMIFQIELKGPGTEAVVPDAIKHAGLAHRIRITSFNHDRVLEVKNAVPDVMCGYLLDAIPEDPEVFAQSPVDSLHIWQEACNTEVVSAIHREGKQVAAMGKIESETMIMHLIELGVDIIGSDRPDVVFSCLKKRNV